MASHHPFSAERELPTTASRSQISSLKNMFHLQNNESISNLRPQFSFSVFNMNEVATWPSPNIHLFFVIHKRLSLRCVDKGTSNGQRLKMTTKH
eukprot:c33954_g1_i1 orf=404-685(+)